MPKEHLNCSNNCLIVGLCCGPNLFKRLYVKRGNFFSKTHMFGVVFLGAAPPRGGGAMRLLLCAWQLPRQMARPEKEAYATRQWSFAGSSWSLSCTSICFLNRDLAKQSFDWLNAFQAANKKDYFIQHTNASPQDMWSCHETPIQLHPIMLSSGTKHCGVARLRSYWGLWTMFI